MDSCRKTLACLLMMMSLGLGASAYGKSSKQLLMIVDDVEQPLMRRGKAAMKLQRRANRDKWVCAELVRRAGFDPIGEEIFHFVTWSKSRCEKKWGEEIAKELLEEVGPERFTAWDWLNCDYLRRHPEVARQVVALGDYHMEQRLWYRLHKCDIEGQQKTLAATRTEPHQIFSSEIGRSRLLDFERGAIEVVGDHYRVWIWAYSTPGHGSYYALHLTVPIGAGISEGILRTSALCLGVPWEGELVSGTARIDADEMKISLDELSFRGRSEWPPDSEYETITFSVDDLPLWQVRGLAEWVTRPRKAAESLPQLESWHDEVQGD